MQVVYVAPNHHSVNSTTWIISLENQHYSVRKMRVAQTVAFYFIDCRVSCYLSEEKQVFEALKHNFVKMNVSY